MYATAKGHEGCLRILIAPGVDLQHQDEVGDLRESCESEEVSKACALFQAVCRCEL